MTSQPTSIRSVLVPLTAAQEDPLPARTTPLPKASKSVHIVNLLAVIIPFAAFVASIALLWGVAFNWLYLGLMVAFYLVSGLGITVGYHRLFTHKSFSTSRFMTWFWSVAGAMAAQGSILEWAASHRQHHQHSDDHDDPHSPHTHGEEHGSVKGTIKGFLHAHVGWLLWKETAKAPDYAKYVPDLMKDKIIAHQHKFWQWYLLAGILVPGLIAWAATGSLVGLGLGVLWGGLARIFLLHHVTWSVNSVCHLWGSRAFESHDESRNNPIFGVLALGEGWHNNHHAFPASARHGLAWWQFDISYIVIRAMGLVRMTWDIKVPGKDRLAARKIKK